MFPLLADYITNHTLLHAKQVLTCGDAGASSSSRRNGPCSRAELAVSLVRISLLWERRWCGVGRRGQWAHATPDWLLGIFALGGRFIFAEGAGKDFSDLFAAEVNK